MIFGIFLTVTGLSRKSYTIGKGLLLNPQLLVSGIPPGSPRLCMDIGSYGSGSRGLLGHIISLRLLYLWPKKPAFFKELYIEHIVRNRLGVGGHFL